MSAPVERDYVLGTHDPEIVRLGLQHRVWRHRVLDLWRRCGVNEGQSVLDLGCGPGHAALDLAELVGPAGRVVAVDRSHRFLEALKAAAAARGLTHIDAVEADIAAEALTLPPVDRAWCRWLLIFAADPAAVIANAARALKPGGVLMLHEYVDYGAWSVSPRSEAFDRFVAAVMASWREHGGDPDIGRRLPRLLAEAGLETTAMEPVVYAPRPHDPTWRWPASFVQSGLDRLVAIKALDQATADQVQADWAALERDPHAFTLTPTVLEITAVKRR